jgi:hypothetical protein
MEMAEGVGFEPTVPVKGQRFSRPPQSTALPSLRPGGIVAEGFARVNFQSR